MLQHISSLPVTRGLCINLAEMACYGFKFLPAHLLSRSYKESCWLRVVTHSGVIKRCWLLLSSSLLLIWLAFQNRILRWPDASATEVHLGQIQRCKRLLIMTHKMYFYISQICNPNVFIIIILTLYGNCFVRRILFTLKVPHITSYFFLSLACLKFFTHSRFMCAVYVLLRYI
jgi:hypothetical protein